MDFSGFHKEVIKYIFLQGSVGVFSGRPSFLFVFSAKPQSRLHLLVRNFLRLEATMQENISTSIPASATPKPIQQTDIEQDYNFFQAQKIAKNMLELGLISLSEFNKLTEINRETFSPFWVEIMPKIP
nr:MAG TPA: hypothetical protein [Caudoviricetes sp.]